MYVLLGRVLEVESLSSPSSHPTSPNAGFRPLLPSATLLDSTRLSSSCFPRFFRYRQPNELLDGPAYCSPLLDVTLPQGTPQKISRFSHPITTNYPLQVIGPSDRRASATTFAEPWPPFENPFTPFVCRFCDRCDKPTVISVCYISKQCQYVDWPVGLVVRDPDC